MDSYMAEPDDDLAAADDSDDDADIAPPPPTLEELGLTKEQVEERLPHKGMVCEVSDDGVRRFWANEGGDWRPVDEPTVQLRRKGVWGAAGVYVFSRARNRWINRVPARRQKNEDVVVPAAQLDAMAKSFALKFKPLERNETLPWVELMDWWSDHKYAVSSVAFLDTVLMPFLNNFWKYVKHDKLVYVRECGTNERAVLVPYSTDSFSKAYCNFKLDGLKNISFRRGPGRRVVV